MPILKHSLLRLVRVRIYNNAASASARTASVSGLAESDL